jgi:hypothetical protein
MPERYYPRYLGVATPRGQQTYEFLITGDEEMGALAKVALLFASHKINLNMVGTYQSDGSDGFVFNMYADFAKADCSPSQLVEELKDIQAVRTVETEDVSESLFDRFLFPVMMAKDMRAVVVIASALVSVETHFSKFLGQQGRHLMFESGKQAGLSILKNTRALAQKSSTEELLANLRERLRTTGWGIFSFDTSAVEKGTIEVIVLQPIFSEVDGVQESWYTFGLASGLMEGVFGSPLVLASSGYKRDAKELAFRLQEQTNKTNPLKALR